MSGERGLVPMFPLGTVFLPGDAVPLRVFEERYVAMIRDLLADDARELSFGSVLIERGHEVGGSDVRRPRGVLVRIENISATPDGGYSLLGRATDPIRVAEWAPDHPYPRANISAVHFDESGVETRVAERTAVLAQMTRTVITQLLELQGVPAEQVSSPLLARVASGQWLGDVTAVSLNEAAWTVARHVPVGPEDRYDMLCAESVEDRVGRIAASIEHVVEMVAFRRGQEP